MGFFAKLKFGDSLGKKAKKSSNPPLPPQCLEKKQQDEEEEEPIIFIVGSNSPPSKQSLLPSSSVTDINSISSLPRKVKGRPTPLTLSAQESPHTTESVQNDTILTISPLHRHVSLISSSLVTPRTPATISARQRQDQLDSESRTEELKSTPPAELGMRNSIDAFQDDMHYHDPSVSTPSKVGYSRLFRKASERVIDYTLSRPTSQTVDRHQDSLNQMGRSFSSASNISLASTRSCATAVTARKSSIELTRTPSMKTVWRRSRAMSNASTKEISPALSSTAAFSRSNLGQADDVFNDSLSTTLQANPPSPLTGNDELAFPVRWRKLSKKSLRSSTPNITDDDSTQLCMLRLSPPPRGLPADDIEGRKKLVCLYVQGRLSDEKKRMAKVYYKRPMTVSSPNNATMMYSAEECIEKLEDDFHHFMIADIKQDLDALGFKELHLADVFIEARRCLGIDSMCLRLHAMFDITQLQISQATAQEAKREAREIRPPSMSPPPPSAWDNNIRKSVSLTPAPRRKRRPKTTPVNSTCSSEDLRREIIPFKDSTPPIRRISHPDSDLTPDSSLEGSTLIHAEVSKDSALQKASNWTSSIINPTTAVTFPTMHDSTSFPPSPPKSIDSHHYGEVAPSLQHNRPDFTSHTRILSEVLAL